MGNKVNSGLKAFFNRFLPDLTPAQREFLPENITTKFSLGALGRLLDPFSSLVGNGKQYVPSRLVKLFTPNKLDVNNPFLLNSGPGKAAHVLAKLGTQAAVFGGAAYLFRALLHSLDVDNLEAMKAHSRASDKLQTAKTRPIAPVITLQDAVANRRNEAKQERPIKKQESYHMVLGALAPLTALAAVITAFKMSDKHFDKAFGKKLDTELSQARTESQELALNRILTNRGLEVQAPMLKKKAFFESVQAAAGILLATLMVTGGIYGFNRQRNNSESYAKYKAYKKGLETYNKQRELSDNIQNSPLSDQLVAQLDANLDTKNKPTVQQQTVSEVFV